MNRDCDFPVPESLPFSLGAVRRNGFILIGVFVLVVTMWGGYAPISQAIIVHGALRPAKPPVEIRYPTDGVLKEVLVREGTLVKRGETVAVMDKTRLMLRRDSVRRMLLSLELERLRLQSELNGDSDLKVSEELAVEISSLQMLDVLRLEQEQLRLSQESYKHQRNALESRFDRLSETTDQLNQRLGFEMEQIVSAQNVTESLESLLAGGRVKATELEKARRAYLSLRARAAETHTELTQTRLAFSDATHESSRIPVARRIEKNTRLSALNRLLLEHNSSLSTIEMDIQSMIIKSPVDGVILNLYHHNSSEQASKNTHLMTITPKFSIPSIEIRLKPEYIHHIQIGSRLNVYLDYKSNDGGKKFPVKVARISPDSVKSDHGTSLYYTVVVNFESEGDAMTDSLALRPGMPIEARIEVGTQTFLEYLFEPIGRTIKYAFAA